MSRTAFHDASDDGQAAVEFAVVLPLIAMLLTVIAQIAIIIVSQLDVIDESRHIARLAALAQDPASAAYFALPPDSPSSVAIRFDDETVTVEVSRDVPTDMPIIGRFTPSIAIRERVTVLREPLVP